MSEYVKYATSAGDQYLAAMSEMQETFLKSLAPLNQMVSSMPKMPSPSFMPELPTPAEISEANFAFATKLLKQQKKFTDKFFSVTTPDESA